MINKRQQKVWVLIADAEHARVVTPVDSHGRFATTLSFDSALANLGPRDLGSERSGRSFESANSDGHVIVSRRDPHKWAKHDFIVEVAKQIDMRADAGEFDGLVLVAPDHAMHDLREALSANAGAMVVGSLTKDLSKTPNHDLAPHLAEWWPKPPADAATVE